MVIRRGREYVERGKEGKGNRWGRLKVGKGMEKEGKGKRKGGEGKEWRKEELV